MINKNGISFLISLWIALASTNARENPVWKDSYASQLVKISWFLPENTEGVADVCLSHSDIENTYFKKPDISVNSISTRRGSRRFINTFDVNEFLHSTALIFIKSSDKSCYIFISKPIEKHFSDAPLNGCYLALHRLYLF